MPDMHDVASEALRHFQTRYRADGDPYVCLADDAPDWVHDLVREAHGHMPPDDWRYKAISAALSCLAERPGEDLDELRHEYADGMTDTYSADRLRWLASHLDRTDYVDEAVEDLGYPGDILGAIGMGQDCEAREVWQSVVDSLEARLSEVGA